MKKLLYLFCASLLVMTSCSSDDDSNSVDPVNLTLVKKTVSTGMDGDRTSLITYNGNKIVSIVTNNVYKTNFTYTGDVITKIESLDEKNVVDDVTEYTYVNGKVVSFIEKDVEATYNSKTKYTYNTDGTISYEKFNINKITGTEVAAGNSGKYTFKDGNLIKIVDSRSSVVYEYDTKNNPYKNVLGFNQLLDNEELGSINNSVKRTSVSGSDTYVYKITFVYDGNNFPTEEKSFDSTGKLENTIQYFY
jgi:hypothetical protein